MPIEYNLRFIKKEYTNSHEIIFVINVFGKSISSYIFQSRKALVVSKIVTVKILYRNNFDTVSEDYDLI